jgi:hypothetical protein
MTPQERALAADDAEFHDNHITSKIIMITFIEML